MDYGKESRMNILERDFNSRVANLLKGLGWSFEIIKRENNGEYLLIELKQRSVSKIIALLYSQSTATEVYNKIENEADACLINGMGFNSNNSFSKSFSKPLMSISDIQEIIKDWSHDLIDVPIDNIPEPLNNINKINDLRVTADNPTEQAWIMLKMLRSFEFCKNIISNRFIELETKVVEEKAKGLSFLIQNACDYFAYANNQNTIQRLLNLYYGSLTFMEADIIANSLLYSSLNEIESITKNGHGLYTFNAPQNEQTLESLYVGVLGKGRGIFPTWLELHSNINEFPIKRTESKQNEYAYNLDEILCRIPEIGIMMELISSDYKPGYLKPYYPMELNNSHTSLFNCDKGYSSKINGTYIILYDESGKSTI